MPSKKSKQSKSKNQKPKGLKVSAKPIAKAPRRNGGSLRGASGIYATALTRPFHDSSYGARVPDMYAAPTGTHHIRRLITITSDAAGSFTALVMPSITTHMIIPTGTTVAGNGSDWQPWDAVTAKPLGLVSSSPSANAGRLSNHRIVSYGVRVRNIASMTNVSGRFTAAKIAIKDDMIIPDRRTVGTAGTSQGYFTRQEWYQAAGIPIQGTTNDFTATGYTIDPDTLQNLPQSVTMSNLELAERGLEIIPKIITPYAFGFRNTTSTKAGNDPSPSMATGAINVGDDDYIKFGGFESVLLAGSGCTPSTAVYTVEIIYHVEGTPTIVDDNVNGFGQGLVQDTPVLSITNIGMFNKALDFAAKAASYAYPAVAVTNLGLRAVGSGLAMISA